LQLLGGKISTLLVKNIEGSLAKSIKDLDFHEVEQKIEREYFYSQFFLEYSEKYFNCGQQLSFLVHDNTTVQAVALVYPIDTQSITYFGLPIKIFFSDSVSASSQKNINGLCTSHLESLVEKYRFNNMLIDLSSSLGMSYYQVGTNLRYNIDSVVDLNLTEEELKLGVRKSYKSLINWGQKNLSMEIVDAVHGTKEQFDDFRNLHIQVAGRETRSKDSWECQYDSIKKNKGHLVLAKLNNELVSGVLNLYGHEEVYYGVGVNRRDLMEQKIAIGHYPIWYSILEAKKRNLKTYNLGCIGPTFHADKERDIASFKKGFSPDLRISHSLSVTFGKPHDQ